MEGAWAKIKFSVVHPEQAGDAAPKNTWNDVPEL
jgi:hypothetical protein